MLVNLPGSGGTLAKQTADLHCLETALSRGREIAEELGEIVIVYFIDMALAETRTKNPPLAKDNNLERTAN
jgi:hypothetical protein